MDAKTGNSTTTTVKRLAPNSGTLVTTTTAITVTPAGAEASRTEVTETVTKTSSGSSRIATAMVKSVSGDEETSYVSEQLDSTGSVTSGTKTVVKVDPVKKTKTTTKYNWDAGTRSYAQEGEPKVEPIAMATHPTVYLPDTASSGSVITGTVETQVNEAAAGTVTVTGPSGDHTTIVGTGGHFLLPPAWVVEGAKLIIKDELGNIIGNEVLHVLPGVPPGASLPQIVQVPAILPQGGIAHVTGSNLCLPTAVTTPTVVVTTAQTAEVIPALASSDKEVKFQVPRTTPTGAGSLSVENGAGQMSAPKPVNPVKISITTPPTVRVGQAFDAAIAIEGLTAENRQKALTATVVVSGNATFANGQRELRVPIKDGAAKVPVVAKGPGGYEVRVTGISG